MVKVVLLLFFLGGCASQFSPPEEYVAVSPDTGLSCSLDIWSGAGGAVGLRHTVFLEIREEHRVLQGLMLVDRDRGQIRIAGLTELGMKLFDLSVREQELESHYLSSALGERREPLAQLVASSVRRIFLYSRPASEAKVYMGPHSVLVHSSFQGEPVLQECTQADGRLTQVSCPRENWQVDYTEYQDIDGMTLPGRIIYNDERAGFRLVLVLHEVQEK